MDKKILIITHSDDNVCIDRVIHFLEKEGAQVYQFNSDHYPVFIQISARINPNGEVQRIIISPDTGCHKRLRCSSGIRNQFHPGEQRCPYAGAPPRC